MLHAVPGVQLAIPGQVNAAGLTHEFAPWFELHHRRMQRAAETAQNLVTPFGWFPFDRVATERPRHADRLLGVPPRRQRLCVEEGFQYFARRRRNHEVGGEFEHASLCPFDVLNR